MQLTEEQKKQVSQWTENGAGLSEIQSRLADEFGVRLSFMETRFLILDIGAQIKDKVQPEQPKPAPPPPAPPASDDDELDDETDEYEAPEPVEQKPATAGAVSVDISPIARPGFALTGTVVFSDGVKGEWGITNDGRFALESETPGYKPSNADIREFQTQLRNQMARKGY
ncbi:MAG: hypothetical protein FWG05_00230 [Kiritimatiellaeota bacterium]|nr:hypothetical protein [Kiritimatiellota bacterium]